jgi:hypothetical protein
MNESDFTLTSNFLNSLSLMILTSTVNSRIPRILCVHSLCHSQQPLVVEILTFVHNLWQKFLNHSLGWKILRPQLSLCTPCMDLCYTCTYVGIRATISLLRISEIKFRTLSMHSLCTFIALFAGILRKRNNWILYFPRHELHTFDMKSQENIAFETKFTKDNMNKLWTYHSIDVNIIHRHHEVGSKLSHILIQMHLYMGPIATTICSYNF